MSRSGNLCIDDLYKTKKKKLEFSIMIKQEVEQCEARLLEKSPDHVDSWVLMSSAATRKKCSKARNENR